MSSDEIWARNLVDVPDRQRRAIEQLTLWCKEQRGVSSLSVGCSLGRGAGDELSDVDAAIGVMTVPGREGEVDLHRVERALVAALPDLGDLVDVMRDGATTSEFAIRHVFAQYADRMQLDLAVVAEADVRDGDAAPDFVTVYSAVGAPDRRPRPSAYVVSADQVRSWVFSGWRALLDADKYLHRGSLWEAHHRLHEAREHIWRLWATARGTSYPQHGLSQVLDESATQFPARIEETIAELDGTGLRRAVTAAADVLTDCTRACVPTLVDEPPIAAYARSVLEARTDSRQAE